MGNEENRFRGHLNRLRRILAHAILFFFLPSLQLHTGGRGYYKMENKEGKKTPLHTVDYAGVGTQVRRYAQRTGRKLKEKNNVRISRSKSARCIIQSKALGIYVVTAEYTLEKAKTLLCVCRERT